MPTTTTLLKVGTLLMLVRHTLYILYFVSVAYRIGRVGPIHNTAGFISVVPVVLLRLNATEIAPKLSMLCTTYCLLSLASRPLTVDFYQLSDPLAQLVTYLYLGRR